MPTPSFERLAQHDKLAIDNWTFYMPTNNKKNLRYSSYQWHSQVSPVLQLHSFHLLIHTRQLKIRNTIKTVHKKQYTKAEARKKLKHAHTYH